MRGAIFGNEMQHLICTGNVEPLNLACPETQANITRLHNYSIVENGRFSVGVLSYMIDNTSLFRLHKFHKLIYLTAAIDTSIIPLHAFSSILNANSDRENQNLTRAANRMLKSKCYV